MKSGARILGAIEILQGYGSNLGPFDVYLQQYFRNHRYIGSKDRRDLSDLCYGVWRYYPTLQEWSNKAFANESFRSLMLVYLRYAKGLGMEELSDLFSGEIYCPVPLSTFERDGLMLRLDARDPSHFPGWLETKIPLEERLAFNFEATFDLRINEKKTTLDHVQSSLKDLGMTVETTPLSPVGLRLQKRFNLSTLEVYQGGLIEVQDEGSQILCELLDIKDGETICDYCAGAGGKSLNLASRLSSNVSITATDISTSRLEKMKTRVRRAGALNINIEPIQEVQKQKFDWVLLDVPCSGTGTLRRRPELKAFLQEEDVKAYSVLQKRILEEAHGLVKPGGFLVYMTCSVLDEENGHQITDFILKFPEFKRVNIDPESSRLKDSKPIQGGETIRLSPAHQGTDGFFMAILKRNN